MDKHSEKQYWMKRALMETFGQISPAMEKQLERRKVLEHARDKVGDPAFDRASRRRFWAEYWRRLSVGTAFGVLAFVAFVYIRALSEPVALVVFLILVFLIVAYLTLYKPQACGACGGTFINRLPVYCLECGETYLFHKAGRWLFEKSRARTAAVVKEYREEKYGYQDRLLDEADKLASSKYADLGTEEISRLEEILQDLNKSNLKK